MAYDRYPRNDDSSWNDRSGDDGRWRDRDDRSRSYGGSQGYGSEGYGSGQRFDRSQRYGGSSSQHDNQDGGRDRDYSGGSSASGRSYGSTYGADRDEGQSGRGSNYNDRGSRSYGAQGDRYRGSYASDGHRFADDRPSDDRNRFGNDDRYTDRNRRGERDRGNLEYDNEDRGFLARAGDELRSWFGDEDAERRRERDQRYDERMSRYDDRHSDHAYRSWRDTQVSAFDRDYDEYRQENATRFQNEFTAFRTERQTQRDSLTRVTEHMEVSGSDGEHVGTVDKIRGDRIILTKNDADAGGHHHSIPSRWVGSVDDKVTLRKTASEAKKAWRDEEDQQALFRNQSSQSQQGYGNNRFGNDRNSDGNRGSDPYRGGSTATTGQALGSGTSTTAGTGIGGTAGTTSSGSEKDTDLNRSFPGTY